MGNILTTVGYKYSNTYMLLIYFKLVMWDVGGRLLEYNKVVSISCNPSKVYYSFPYLIFLLLLIIIRITKPLSIVN